MKYKLNKYVLGIITFTVLMSSCDKSSEDLSSLVSKSTTGYVVRDGYLVFDSKESFSKTINNIINLTEAARNKWENEIGFNSQQRITNNVIREELKKDSINKVCKY